MGNAIVGFLFCGGHLVYITYHVPILEARVIWTHCVNRKAVKLYVIMLNGTRRAFADIVNKLI